MTRGERKRGDRHYGEQGRKKGVTGGEMRVKVGTDNPWEKQRGVGGRNGWRKRGEKRLSREGGGGDPSAGLQRFSTPRGEKRGGEKNAARGGKGRKLIGWQKMRSSLTEKGVSFLGPKEQRGNRWSYGGGKKVGSHGERVSKGKRILFSGETREGWSLSSRMEGEGGKCLSINKQRGETVVVVTGRLRQGDPKGFPRKKDYKHWGEGVSRKERGGNRSKATGEGEYCTIVRKKGELWRSFKKEGIS